jgi:hypothetical protein
MNPPAAVWLLAEPMAALYVDFVAASTLPA